MLERGHESQTACAKGDRMTFGLTNFSTGDTQVLNDKNNWSEIQSCHLEG